jgi:hypothetical protein
MALSLRRRSALVLAGVVASVPLWFAAAAHAADPVITFTGVPDITASTVSCPSAPDQPTLNVVPGATVDFVNHLGKTATLISSTSQQDLDDGQMVPVTFAATSEKISIEMLPHCNLDVGVHLAVQVTVQTPVANPSTSATAPAPSRTPGPSGLTSAAASPSASKHPGSVKHTPKHHPMVTPSGSPTLGAAGNGRDADPPMPPPTTSTPLAIGQPIRAVPGPRGASGLLTLIATVSVGGVTAAVIRAIVAQRATRSLID